ncbi:hypothetical protein IFM89_011420 [Coptis chinensis]|uniref:Protein FAR1-RELATED SEQUENCE n=1 Tax=Coptis chinensis TaxID=261450 RepID=A0A835HPJ4_9MAGN|nr:hypothetical protein IFM89_011420 [Coptis chinensis]
MEESHDQECELPVNFSGVAECETSSVQVEKNTIGSPTKDLDNTIKTPYFIKSKADGESGHWTVQWNPHTCEGICECNHYEFVGIPCAHIFKILSKLDLYEIPESFINKRWLKGANIFWRGGKEGSLCQEQVDVMNLSYLCQEATKLACIASQTPASYKLFLDGLRELGKQILEIMPDKVADEDVLEESYVPRASREDPSPVQQPVILLDSNVSQMKGSRKKN